MAAESVFAGNFAISDACEWVIVGMLNGEAATLPSGVLGHKTLPLDVGIAATSNVPVEVYFAPGVCQVQVGEPPEYDDDSGEDPCPPHDTESPEGSETPCDLPPCDPENPPEEGPCLP